MTTFCQNCCNIMFYDTRKTYITCLACRKLGKYFTSVRYGELMNFDLCTECDRQLVDPDRKWNCKKCKNCYYYLKRHVNK